MAWSPVLTWSTDGGSWNSSQGAATTGQRAQSVGGVGAVVMAGAVSSQQVQTTAGLSATVIAGAAATYNFQTVSDGSGIGNGVFLLGQGDSGQAQTTSASGQPGVAGVASSSQVQRSAGSSTSTFYNGATMTGQGAQTALLTGALSIRADASTSTVNGHSSLLGGLSISGAGATSNVCVAAGYGYLPAPSLVKDALQRMLRYPHAAVFDKSPKERAAITFTSDDASFSITGDLLELSVGGASRYFNLHGMSVADLVTAIEAAGIDAAALSEFPGGSAATLLDHGDGALRTRSIQGFTSLLWALFYGYAHEVAEAEYQVGQALRQMVITQAEGEWLDVWGTLYGDSRREAEQDEAYSARIPEEAFRLRVNALGIEKAILDITGFDVRIEEPWKNIFRLDESLLSGTHKFYDGERIGYHLIQPVSDENVDWAAVMPIIHRNRPAGVLVLEPEVHHLSWVDASAGASVASAMYRYAPDRVIYEDRALLDYGTLEDVSVVNHQSLHQRQIIRTSSVDVEDQGWTPHYVVESNAQRDYRTYISLVTYESYFWPTHLSWVTADNTWREVGPFVDSAHSRTT